MSNDGSISVWSMLESLPRICCVPGEPNEEENPARLYPRSFFSTCHPLPPRPLPPPPPARGIPMVIPPPPPPPLRIPMSIPPPPPFARDILTAIPPRRFIPPREINLTDEEIQSLFNSFHTTTVLTPREKKMRLQSMFNLMTNSSQQDVVQSMISGLDRSQIRSMVFLLTSNPHYFLEIASNKNGSKQLKKLLGKSDDLDSSFAHTILRCFPHIMTDKQASYVVTKGLRVFQNQNKETMYEHILYYAIHLARDEHGCVALNEIITDLDNPHYRRQLLDTVVLNAVSLSKDAYGNFVVQHVLKQSDLLSTYMIAVNLKDHCVELSFKKYGSFIVEKLLETEQSMDVVVQELLRCEGSKLLRLARNEYGNFVVGKALRVTKEMSRLDLFWILVQKLKPFRYQLRKSPGRSKISAILETVLSRK